MFLLYYHPTLTLNLLQRPVPRVVEARPTPESTFISDAQSRLSQSNPAPTTLRQGELAQRLLTMQREKNKAIEATKIAVLEAKYNAEMKKAEETARKKLEMEKRKAEIAEEKARQAAERREKKRYDQELTRKARLETKRIIAETKKELAEEKKKKRKEAEATK